MKFYGFVLALLLAFGFTMPPNVKLEYKFKPGDAYSWSQTTKQTIKQSVMGMDQNVETFVEGETELKVTELTSTGAKIETRFKKLKNRVKSPMGETVMDSEGNGETTENKSLEVPLVFKRHRKNHYDIVVDSPRRPLFNLFVGIGYEYLFEVCAQGWFSKILGKSLLHCILRIFIQPCIF